MAAWSKTLALIPILATGVQPLAAQSPGAIPQERGLSVKESVQQYLSYPSPYAFDVEKVVRLSATPSMSSLRPYLIERATAQNDSPDVKVLDGDDRRIRLRVSNVKSVILQNRRYWEQVFISAILLPTGRLEVSVDCPEGERQTREVLLSIDPRGARSLAVAAPFGGSAPGRFRTAQERLIEEQCRPKEVFELVLVVDGKYVSGGSGKDLAAYEDMLTGPYQADLEAFAATVASGYADILKNNPASSLDMRRNQIR